PVYLRLLPDGRVQTHLLALTDGVTLRAEIVAGPQVDHWWVSQPNVPVLARLMRPMLCLEFPRPQGALCQAFELDADNGDLRVRDVMRGGAFVTYARQRPIQM